MFISQKEKDVIKRDVARLRSDVDWIGNETRRIDKLFAKDRHGTVRPKVDMLSDLLERIRSDVLDGMSRLFRRIEKLEKK